MRQIPNENFSEPPAKRRRGRPRGSKNKLKPASLRPLVLEISEGGDIAEAITNLSRRLGGSVSILTSNGSVSSAVLKQPSSSSTADLTLRGCYEIISISTSFIGRGGGGGILVTMAGMNGEVVGGILAGPLMAAGNVVVVVAELSNPIVHDLLAVKESDSGQDERELRNDTEQNEEEEFQMSKRDEDTNFVVGGGDADCGDNDEWCRNWFGKCEKEVRRCFDLLTAGELGNGFGAGEYEGLFT